MAPWLHGLSYILVLGTVATGLATAITTGRHQVVFEGEGGIPAVLASSPSRVS